MLGPRNNTGRTLKDCIYEGGVKGKIFVDVLKDSIPYIVKSAPYQSEERYLSLSQGYFFKMTYVGKEVKSTGKNILRESSGSLIPHLEDPVYDPLKIDNDTPLHRIVDNSSLSQELLKR